MSALAAQDFPVIDFDDYLKAEERANQRHEYFYGHVYAMAGGSAQHSFIAMDTVAAIRRALGPRKCSIGGSDLLIETPNQNAGFYPDLSVHCFENRSNSARTQTAPIVVVEVLSPSTRKYDLTTKLKEYMLVPSLRHIVFIDSEAVHVRVYSRGKRTTWLKDPLVIKSLDAELPLDSLAIRIKLRAIYGGTDLVE